MKMRLEKITEWRATCPYCDNFIYHCFDKPIEYWQCPECKIEFEVEGEGKNVSYTKTYGGGRKSLS